MRRFLVLSLFFPLLTLICTIARAQSLMTPADFTEWNRLTQIRTPSSYHSIIHDPDTRFVPGSDYGDATTATFPIPLPCSMYYIDTLYQRGYALQASIGGFVGFGGSTTCGAWPYKLMPSTGFDRLIMPFWSDLKTTGGADQGIFYRFDVDPTTYDSTLTIEWSVETMSFPYTHGGFQVHLHQVRPDAAHFYTWRTEIRFDYDLSNPIDRRVPHSYGAVIGLKNNGQGWGDPGAIMPGVDDGNSLMLVDTGVIAPDNAAITRLPTRTTAYQPDWFANVTSIASPYYHYYFPDSGYAALPLETDVHPDYMPPPHPSGTTGFPILPIGSLQAIGIVAENLGIQTQLNVPIVIVIKRDTTTVLSTTMTVDTLRALTKVIKPLSLPTSPAGQYTILTTITVPGDQNRTNDSAVITYYVAPQHDGTPLAISSPILVPGAQPLRYAAGLPIPIDVRLANSGMLASTFYASYAVYDRNDSIVSGRTDTVNSQLIPPMHDINYSFGSFTPSTPGLYRIAVTCSAVGDQIPTNDLLFSLPRRDWTTHGPSPNAPGVRPISFKVYPAIDLAVGQPQLCMPRDSDTIAGPTHLFALFFNNGASDVNNIMVHAVITDANDSMVYDRTDPIPSMAGGGTILSHYFPDFTPETPGVYCVTVTIHSDSLDLSSGNDMAHWCFTVIDTTVDTGNGGGNLTFLQWRSSTSTIDAADPVSARAGAVPPPPVAELASRRRWEPPGR